MCLPLPINADICNIIEKLWAARTELLNFLRGHQARMQELQTAADGLGAKMKDVKNSIPLAEPEGKAETYEAQQWEREVEALQAKVTAFQDEYRHLGGWSWDCFSMNESATKMLDEINKLVNKVGTIQLTTRQPPPPHVHLPISESIKGMDSYVKKIFHYIVDENASIIGIYGMAGVGKTTLLKQCINNLQKMSSLFDHVIWVFASKDCKLRKLQLDIAKRLELKTMEEKDNSEEANARKLFDFLRNKRCLLLLDDIWERQDLQLLGMTNSTPEHGQPPKRKVVVFTTRSVQVCGEMRAEKRIQVKCLGPDEAWELFQKNVGGDVINSDAGINRIAKQIAQECAGLPLGLITVGQAMSMTKSWEAWKYALTQLKNAKMQEISSKKEKDPMYSVFKLSYDNLEDDSMRARLLCCSLWPEDYFITKEELIDCWMGLGLIEEFNMIHEAYDRGYSHIDALIDACLLELDDEYNRVKMHDVIRDIALLEASDRGVSKRKWIVRAGVGLRQVPEEVDWGEVEGVSLMGNNITTLPKSSFNYQNLSMLILQNNFDLVDISGMIFECMPSLTYLDLSYTGIKELPKEIGMLFELWYLDLSFSGIEALPEELGSLFKLKYLFLRRTSHLTFVPKGTISNLSSLRLLDLYGSDQYNGLDEIECLQGCQKCIGITINTIANPHRLCSLQNVSTRQLQLQEMSDLDTWDELMEGLLRSHNTRQCLEQLHLEKMGMVELLMPCSLSEEGFDCLKELWLLKLNNLTEIIWKEVKPEILFPNLRVLSIISCPRLRNVTWTLQLPCLNYLYVFNCDDMEELISDAGTGSSTSPLSTFGLMKLELIQLPNLNYITRQPLSFPYLEFIEVDDCEKLKRIAPSGVQISINMSRVKVIRGQRDWLENR